VDVGWKVCGEEFGDPHGWTYCQAFAGVEARNQPMLSSGQSSREACPNHPRLPDGFASSAKRQETAYALDTEGPLAPTAAHAHVRRRAGGWVAEPSCTLAATNL
jgi:hypothetical protein